MRNNIIVYLLGTYHIFDLGGGWPLWERSQVELCSSGIQQMPLMKKHEVKLAFSVLQLQTINEPHSYESEVMENGDRYFTQKK